MGLSVLFINVEAWLVKRLVNALTKEEGFFVPEFHPHPLFFADTLLHHCDMCRAKTKQSYRCQVCDFDVCPPCFNKKDKATGEGMLRGDKGLKPMETLKLSQYLKRGLKLARPEIPPTLTLTLTRTRTRTRTRSRTRIRNEPGPDPNGPGPGPGPEHGHGPYPRCSPRSPPLRSSARDAHRRLP